MTVGDFIITFVNYQKFTNYETDIGCHRGATTKHIVHDVIPVTNENPTHTGRNDIMKNEKSLNNVKALVNEIHK